MWSLSATSCDDADHPLSSFSPARTFGAKKRTEWTLDEAERYRTWLLSALDGRVAAMLEILEEPMSSSTSEHLKAVGEKIAALLVRAPFSEDTPSGRKLTNAGYALAADVGLLAARYLLDHPPEIHWVTMKKPKEMSCNLPILRGFSVDYLDPVGGSTAEAAAVLRGKRGGDAWLKIYEFWRQQV